jgi:sporulation protein YunB
MRWLNGRTAQKRHGKRRILFYIVLLAAGAVLFYIWTDSKISPIVAQMAVTRVHYLAGQSVNEAINDVMVQKALDYGDLILFERDVEGRVSAIKTNVTGINKLKTDVSRQVLDRIENIEKSELSIPFGSIFRNDLLMARGPRVQVRLIPIGSVYANLENIFTAAGINQTRHQIVMIIRVDMSVAAWGNNVETHVISEVVVAETIIVGSVPEYYLNIGDEIFS